MHRERTDKLMTNNQKVREPLFHIVKRSAIPWWKAWIIRIVSVIFALVVSGILTVFLTHQNPLEVYATMLEGAFSSQRRIWMLMQNLAVLLCISLAVTPAFKMRFWNLGAEGQVLIGGLATMACMFYLGPTMSTPALIFVMVIASIASAAVWALLPAIFKAYMNANETLFTLMMNYIAIQVVAFFCSMWAGEKSTGKMPVVEYGWLPTVFGQKYLLNIIIVAVLTVIMYIYLKYSKHGYEISVVGESENTARYIGINVKKVIIRTMLVSGAVCGIAGLILVAGTEHTIDPNYTVAGRGFTAVMVSWLAKFNPLIMVITSFLIVFLQRGASQISETFKLNKSFPDIITGIIIFFIIGSEFFINYSIKFTSRHKEGTR